MKLPLQTVLVPVDFSATSLAAAVEAHELLGPEGRLHVVHVLAAIGAGEPGAVWGRVTDGSRKEHAREALEAAMADCGLATGTCFVRVSPTGNAAHEIVELAEELGVDMIVMPSHGRTGLARIAIGSVAERVVRHASCPVLVLRR